MPKNILTLSMTLWLCGLPLVSCISQRAGQALAASTSLKNCQENGWQQLEFNVEGKQNRRLLYKLPSGNWENGAILVLHGGGGHPEHFCDDSTRLLKPQVRFTELALSQKFAVFALDSYAETTDADGLLCGKIWDDEVRTRPNHDLPYLKHIMTSVIPSLRKSGDNLSLFMTGLSSGGYMTVRAATHFGKKITAFAPISNGDPYGWRRRCDPKYGNKRDSVKGAGFDNETGKEIIEPNSCASESYAHEKKWDDPGVNNKPKFRLFHSAKDGINDYSCSLKVEKQLKQHGYVGEDTYLLVTDHGKGRAPRHVLNHFWQNEYNTEILDFFKRNRK